MQLQCFIIIIIRNCNNGIQLLQLYAVLLQKRRQKEGAAHKLPLGISDPVRFDLCSGSTGLGVLTSLPASWGPHHDLIILTDHSMQSAAESSGVCFCELHPTSPVPQVNLIGRERQREGRVERTLCFFLHSWGKSTWQVITALAPVCQHSMEPSCIENNKDILGLYFTQR